MLVDELFFFFKAFCGVVFFSVVFVAAVCFTLML